MRGCGRPDLRRTQHRHVRCGHAANGDRRVGGEVRPRDRDDRPSRGRAARRRQARYGRHRRGDRKGRGALTEDSRVCRLAYAHQARSRRDGGHDPRIRPIVRPRGHRRRPCRPARSRVLDLDVDDRASRCPGDGVVGSCLPVLAAAR